MKYAFVQVADIHYRKDAPEGASSIMKAFLYDLEQQTKNFPSHQFYIAFAGDIVQAGQDSSAYEKFIYEMDEKLNAAGLKQDTRIIVPGNHDLNRCVVEKSFTQYNQACEAHTQKESNFNDFIDETTLLQDKFSNFEKFACSFARHDNSFQRQGWGVSLNNDIGVYCLNTALCSFGGYNNIDDEGRLAVYTRGVVDWCSNTTAPVKILLHHHPFDHLNSWSREELQHIVDDNFTLCLSGHNHLPQVYHAHVPQKALVCTAPPLFCGKDSTLAYSIIFIESNEPSSILYREYSNGKFFPSSRLSKKNNGRVEFESTYLLHLQEMELRLQHALEAFKGQKTIFLEPTLSKKREFNNDPNELHPLIDSPYDTLIVAPPQFGLTCLGLYLRLEAFKNRKFWAYIDAKHTKGRKIIALLEEELLHFNKNRAELNCIILDSWDAKSLDHITMLKHITENYPDLPIVILSEDSNLLDPSGVLSKFDKNFQLLHLQALSRMSMRKLIANHNETQHIGPEDVVLSSLAKHMESINVHRTPLNCYTLLRVLNSSYNEKLLNKSKLLKAILFVLFTDYDSFSHLSDKPEVEECAFVLGSFCKDLIKHASLSFDADTFIKYLKETCKKNCIEINVDAMLNVLLENNILVSYENEFEFRHRYWIFFFAAEWMRHDEEFKQFILAGKNYVNYPEIIEFYTSTDGKRSDAMESLIADLTFLTDKVDKNIGIDRSFDPLAELIWDPSDKYIQHTKSQITEKVASSNLPADIKDKQADDRYNSGAPYDQRIRKFLNEYSVLSLMHSIKATSLALRSSTFVGVELRQRATKAILEGWEQILRVIFWLSPLLAKEGRAIHDGLALILAEGFSEDLNKRFKEIILASPPNTVSILGDELASKKIGALLYETLKTTDSKLQKHMLAIFIIIVRPKGWYEETLNYINLLHPSSYYLGSIFETLTYEIQLGDFENNEEPILKQLTSAILNKREYAPKSATKGNKKIAPNMVLNEENKLPIDVLLKDEKKRKPSR